MDVLQESRQMGGHGVVAVRKVGDSSVDDHSSCLEEGYNDAGCES